ncbi:MAG TPA: cytochrome c [Pyrinomonadaceae bacterium]|jgi:mono/diheme cytochrome c family protein|nr:cytochrome c [Pyrinomonadaceae bacterium]
MWKSEQQTADGRRQTAGSGFVCALNAVFEPRFISCLLLSAVCLLAASCRRDMQDQPKMKPFRSSTFFRDGLSARPPIEGTVPRGFLKEDTEFFTGKKAGRTAAKASASPASAQSPAGPQPSASAAPQGAAAYPDDVETFPIAVTKDVVTRGKERYEIFCSACHGFTGNGDGMIVRRGFRRAASFNDDRLRQAPVGHFFDAISNGWGTMPAYAPQIAPQDRWAIIAYIRALQLSQQTEANQSGQSPAATPGATPTSGGHQ